MSSIIDSKLAGYEEELKKAKERLSELQTATNQTTQQVVALQGAIAALNETKEAIASDQGSETAECNLPQ